MALVTNLENKILASFFMLTPLIIICFSLHTNNIMCVFFCSFLVAKLLYHLKCTSARNCMCYYPILFTDKLTYRVWAEMVYPTLSTR